MSSSFQSLAYRSLLHTPFGLVRHLTGKRFVALTYHTVSDVPLPHIARLYPYRNVREFNADIDTLLANFQPISLHDVLDCLNTGRPFPRRSCLLTFDDGLRECHDVIAPLLLRKGIPATFFLISGCLDNQVLPHFCKQGLILDLLNHNSTAPECARQILTTHGLTAKNLATTIEELPSGYAPILDAIGAALNLDFAGYLRQAQPFLTSPQVERLIADGFTIGAHSVDHPLFRDLTLAEQLHQANASMQTLQQSFGIGYRTFAFPHHGHGVKREFFETLLDRDHFEAVFGMDGLLDDDNPRSLQRLNMEYKELPARVRLQEVSAAHAVARLTGHARLQRE